MVIDFVALTIGTSLNLVSDVFAHLWPPVIALYELHCFADAWVSVYQQVMVYFNKLVLAF
jgi:hypothetical protein